jgi:hypothetical protein
MRHQLWIIEARDESGQLKLDCPQADSFFGMGAIIGMTEDTMAKTIFRKIPDATLDGGSIAAWPKLINPHWTARKKTW